MAGVNSFSDLGLAQPIIRELTTIGVSTPMPIQAATIPDALAGKDVLGKGPTGSGKTFAFGLPMIQLLGNSPSLPAHPRGLIIVPTRELAAQVRERLDDPAHAMNLRVLDVVGGVPIKRHITALARPVDILVATPGRAQDLINQRKLFLDKVEITALDEADQMADMGFLPQVQALLKLTPAGGQRLLFSATLDNAVKKLVDRFLHNPVQHSTVVHEAAVETMDHHLFTVADKPSRNDVVLRIAARDGRTVMFMRTKHAVDRQVKKLRRAGIDAVGLHGDKSQNQRALAINRFTTGASPVLVATDIAARGIDIKGVSLVVHIDPPAEHKAYVHRAGRTARAGDSGTVVTLVMPEQIKDVRKLLKQAGVNATETKVDATSPALTQITGAREPSGQPLSLRPGEEAAQSSHPRTRHGGDRNRGKKHTRRGGGRGNSTGKPAKSRPRRTSANTTPRSKKR